MTVLHVIAEFMTSQLQAQCHHATREVYEMSKDINELMEEHVKVDETVKRLPEVQHPWQSPSMA